MAKLLAVLLAAGQAGDNPQLVPLLDAIRAQQGGPGRPRKKLDMLIADKDRNQIERAFHRLKQFRAVATRYDKVKTATTPP